MKRSSREIKNLFYQQKKRLPEGSLHKDSVEN